VSIHLSHLISANIASLLLSVTVIVSPVTALALTGVFAAALMTSFDKLAK
jgi:hypothetical protein